jgi:hypothetical protein
VCSSDLSLPKPLQDQKLVAFNATHALSILTHHPSLVAFQKQGGMDGMVKANEELTKKIPQSFFSAKNLKTILEEHLKKDAVEIFTRLYENYLHEHPEGINVGMLGQILSKFLFFTTGDQRFVNGLMQLIDDKILKKYFAYIPVIHVLDTNWDRGSQLEGFIFQSPRKDVANVHFAFYYSPLLKDFNFCHIIEDGSGQSALDPKWVKSDWSFILRDMRRTSI